MLNRKATMVAPPAFGFARSTNEGMFIRRVSAFAEDSKRPSADEASSPDWSSMDSTLRGVFWSADNLSNVQQQQQHHHLQRNAANASPGSASITQHHLDSPRSSFVGTHPRCTGGGTGEAGPSSSGGYPRFGWDSAGTPHSVSPPSPVRKATHNLLARHVAERHLYSRSVRCSVECVPPQLRTRDVPPLQQHQQHQQHPHAHSISHTLPQGSAAAAAIAAAATSGSSSSSTPAATTGSAAISTASTSTAVTSSSAASAAPVTSTVEKLPSFIRMSSSAQTAAAVAAASAAASAAEAAANGVSGGGAGLSGSFGSFGGSSRLPDPSLPQSALLASGGGGMNGTVAVVPSPPQWTSTGKELGSASASAASTTTVTCFMTPNGSRALTPVTGVSPAARPSRHILLGARPQHQQHQPKQQPRATASTGPFPPASEGYLEVQPGLRPRASTGSIPPTISKQFMQQQQQQQQQQQHQQQYQQQFPFYPQPPPSPPPPYFSPRVTPSPGLIHLWSAAPASMRRGEWSMSQYGIARQLYGGYASFVYKARCMRSGQDVVLKVYSLSSLSDFLRNQVLRELDIHSRLDHPHVVQLLAAFRENDKLVLVLEYVRGGSLDRARRKLGGRMSEPQALELVMAPLLRTLHYLHTRAIVHRDIKPENLLFTSDWKLKVCDYGVSICLSEERAVTRTGSRDYMAPEVQVCPLKRTPEDNKNNGQLAYSAAADIWSVGVLTYEILVGFTPFPGGPPPMDDCSPNACRRLPTFPSCISADARAFVTSCLADVPGDRPTIYELMKHRWVQGAMAV